MRGFVIIVLVSTLALFACERERIISVSSIDSKPVLSLHSIAQPNQMLSLKLERSSGLFKSEGEQDLLQKADISIQWNETTTDFPNYNSVEPGLFIFPDIVPKTGDYLKITAQAEGLVQGEASTFVPGTYHTTLNKISVVEIGSSVQIRADVQLDRKGDSDGYFIIYGEGLIHDPISGEIKPRRFSVSSKDNLIEKRTRLIAEQPGNLLFLHNLQPDINNVEIVTSGIPAHFSPHHPKQKVELVVQKLSRELYEYYLSLYLNNHISNAHPIELPINLYTNVKNGIGVVGGAHTTRLALYW